MDNFKSLPSYSPVVISSGSECSISNTEVIFSLSNPEWRISPGNKGSAIDFAVCAQCALHRLSKNDLFVLTLTRPVKPPSTCYAHFHLQPPTVRCCLRTIGVSPFHGRRPLDVAGWCNDEHVSCVLVVLLALHGKNTQSDKLSLRAPPTVTERSSNSPSVISVILLLVVLEYF